MTDTIQTVSIPAELLNDIACAAVMADASDRESQVELRALIARLCCAEDNRFKTCADECLTLLDNLGDSEPKNAKISLDTVIARINALQLTSRMDEQGARRRLEPDGDQANGYELPPWIDREVLLEFLSNTKHVLEELEQDILAYEKGSSNARAALKRTFHTIKGDAGLLGLEDLGATCHAVEDILEQAGFRNGRVDLLFEVKDWIGHAIEAYAEMRRPSPRGETIVARLHSLNPTSLPAPSPCPKRGGSAPPSSGTTVAREAVFDDETVELIGEFLQESGEGLTQADEILMNAEQDSADPDKVDALFRVFHTIKGLAGFVEMYDVATLAHTTETLLEQVRDGEKSLAGAVLDLVFDATATMRELMECVRVAVEESTAVAKVPALPGLIEKLHDAIQGDEVDEEDLPDARPGMPLGQILSCAPSVVAADVLVEALAAQKETGRRLGEELVARGAAEPKQVAQALRAQKRANQGTPSRIRETVKIDLQRVDSLVEMIGELVIVESMVTHHPEIAGIPTVKVRNHLAQLGKITRDLQDVGMRMRMVPVRGVFQKMARMVRDLARKSGKRVKMEISGEATEMDRSMVERIADPLVHMIRNSVDHGIEAHEQDRVRTGKNPVGCVRLSAYHEGSSVVIELADDGRGLNRDAILAKARARGFVRDGEQLTNGEVNNLIFAPGFSTAEQVTDISGRGVGMDVVKKNIDAMRGRVSIDSVAGKGSTFRIILPLTLAIIEGMLVSCGADKYIIPTLSIIESLRPDPSMLATFATQEFLIIRGDILPLLRLDRLFDIPDAEQNPTRGLVVVVEVMGRRFGLLVDEVLTQQQVVIKTLGDTLGHTDLVSGAAIMSDGRVGLILNIDELAGAMEGTR